MSEQSPPQASPGPGHHPAKISISDQLLRLMVGLIESHVDDCAVLICTTAGRVVWANPFTCDRALDWPLFTHDNKLLYIQDKQILDALRNGSPRQLSIQLSGEKSVYLFEVRLCHSDPAGADGLARASITCQHMNLSEHPDFRGLSPAELRLVCMLEKHVSLKKSAQLLGISYENARTTLKHVFSKLNVHSQEQLRAKVARAHH